MNSTTLYGHLVEKHRSHPTLPAFVDLSHQQPQELTLADLLKETNKAANLLQEQGIGDGDCIAVWLPSWPVSYAWQFAASAVGAYVIGVNTRYNIAEVGHVLRKAQPKLLVMAHDFRNVDFLSTAKTAVAAAQRQDAEFLAPIVIATSAPRSDQPIDVREYDLGSGAIDWSESSHAEPEQLRMTGDTSALSVAFTTSGSTGMPKLAAHSEAAVIHHLTRVSNRIGFKSGDLMVEPLPYSGVFGYVAGMSAFFGGAAVMLQDAFEPRSLTEAWQIFKGTHFVGADDMISRIREAWKELRVSLDSWRWTGIADFQGMSHELAHWTEKEFGTRTVGVYGSSEVFALMTFWETNTPEYLRLNGGGNMTAPDYEFRIADPTRNASLPDGEQGEIQLRGPNVVDTYLGDSGEGKKAFTQDGWFQTGDLGKRTGPDSFEYICRMGDVLRLKGFMVDPSEIETHISHHPAVEIVKVVGRRGESGEDQAVAFVSLHDGMNATEHELIDYCRDQLARYKVPSEIRIVRQMPTTVGTNGSKIKTVTLREWAQQKRNDNDA